MAVLCLAQQQMWIAINKNAENLDKQAKKLRNESAKLRE
jgi:hypothetical protein